MLCETRSNYATTSQNYASNSLDWFDDSLTDAFTYTVLQTHFWLRTQQLWGAKARAKQLKRKLASQNYADNSVD